MTEGLAFYLRLSMADGDLGKDNKDESNSIENQRLLLQSYVEASDELDGEALEYIDDGYTGTNFRRPAFQRMIEDAKKGKVHTILVKDLSRLGRDYIGVGDYLEQIFPVLGIRFIAVNTNYDSNKYIGKTMGLDMAVNNLVNSMYSKDISKKIKSAYRTKWKQGITTGGRPIYGYTKDEKAKGGWKIDPVAAEVVRLVFAKANENWSTRMICDQLNEKGYDTPSLHRDKQNIYGGKRKVTDSECIWDLCMVRSILQRYEYTGAFVHNRRETVQVGTNITRSVPEHQKVVIEDGHEAIITREEYQNAQAAIQFMTKAKFKIDNQYPLRGKIRCGVCKLAMSYLEMAYESVFYCHHKLKTGKYSSCNGEYIPTKEIDRAVLNTLRVQLKLLRELGVYAEETKETHSHSGVSERKRMERDIEIYKAERIRQYEVYAEGIVSRESYLTKKAELTEKIDTLQEALDCARSLMTEEAELCGEIAHINRQAEESMVTDTLTKEMADAFIEMVYVYDNKTVEVEFKFDDLLKKAAEKFARRGNDDEADEK